MRTWLSIGFVKLFIWIHNRWLLPERLNLQDVVFQFKVVEKDDCVKTGGQVGEVMGMSPTLYLNQEDRVELAFLELDDLQTQCGRIATEDECAGIAVRYSLTDDEEDFEMIFTFLTDVRDEDVEEIDEFDEFDD